MRFVWFFFLFGEALFAKEKVDFLFYLQDAGETNALLPVVEALEEEGFTLAILVGGTAEDLVRGLNHSVWTFPDFGGEPILKSWERERKIEPAVLERLRDEIEPKAVVTGVAFAAQGQVLDLYPERPTFAFWDNFNSNGDNPYFSTGRKVAMKASTLLLPCSSVEEDFHGSNLKKVVGHPCIEKWRHEIDPNGEGSAVFIGSYGEEYEEAFSLFLDCAEVSGRSFLVLLHPKTDGFFERALLTQRAGLPVRIATGKSTIGWVSQANLVVCHQSSVAFQALACGKPVIHVIPKGQFFESLPLKKGMVQKVASPEEFCRALGETKSLQPEIFDQIMGIPKDCTARFVEILIEEI